MKRILLSLSVLVMAYTANSQQLAYDDFENYTIGNLQGQPYYYTQSTSSDHSESDFQVVDVPSGTKGVQVTGQSAAQSSKFFYTFIPWSSRTAENDVLYYSFLLKASDITSSKNQFRIAIYDESNNVIGGFGYIPETKELYGRINTTLNGTPGIYRYDLLDNGNTAYTLTENSEIELGMYFDKTTGAVYLVGYANNVNVFTVADLGDFAGVDPASLRFYSIAGTSNAASSTIYIDEIYMKAKPCVLYNTKDDASFSYTTATVCNTASNLTPALVDGSVTGVFTSTPAGLAINSSTGLITTSTSTPGTYTVQFASNVANTCDDSTTVSITVQDCVGLPEYLSSAFSVAPNPAKFNVTVTLSENVELNSVIRLMTSEGKEVETRIVSNNKEEIFNVSDLEAGIYFIQLGDKIEKVIVE